MPELREKVRDVLSQALKESNDPGHLAKEILFLFDQLFDLEGNGWFNDDPEMQRFLSKRYEGEALS